MGTHHKQKNHIDGKHIKHSANINLQKNVEKETTFLVKSSTPFVSALKKINKMLDKFNKTVNKSTNKYQGGEFKKVKYIVVKGMGKSIESTLGLAGIFQDQHDYKVDILTGSVEVLDEFVPEENKTLDDIIYKKRMVSSIELRIWLKRE